MSAEDILLGIGLCGGAGTLKLPWCGNSGTKAGASVWWRGEKPRRDPGGERDFSVWKRENCSGMTVEPLFLLLVWRRCYGAEGARVDWEKMCDTAEAMETGCSGMPGETDCHAAETACSMEVQGATDTSWVKWNRKQRPKTEAERIRKNASSVLLREGPAPQNPRAKKKRRIHVAWCDAGFYQYQSGADRRKSGVLDYCYIRTSGNPPGRSRKVWRH